MANIKLGQAVEAGEDVFLDDGSRDRGLYIVGTTGSGKTTLLQSLVLQDIEAGHGVGVLDPHGDLVDRILPRIPHNRLRDVVLLDPSDSEFPFGLNPFQCSKPEDIALTGRLAGNIVEMFEKLWGRDGTAGTSWGPLIPMVLRNVANVFLMNPGSTMLHIPRFLHDDALREQMLGSVSNPYVIEFWEGFGRMKPHEQQDLTKSTLNKLDPFLGLPIIANILRQPQSTVDFRQFMDDRHIVLMPLRIGRLGSHVADLIGSTLILNLLNAAVTRDELPPALRRPFYIYADEYQRFATPTFAELLTEARKFGIAPTLAHQTRAQLDESNQAATVNAANKVVFSVTGDDAEELAKQFDTSPIVPANKSQMRQKLVISQDPVRHIVRTGHSHAIFRLTADIFHDLVDIADGPNSEILSYPYRLGGGGRFPESYEYSITQPTAQAGLNSLSHLLFRVMDGQLTLKSVDFIERLSGVMVQLRAYFRLAPFEHLTLVRESNGRNGRPEQIEQIREHAASHEFVEDIRRITHANLIEDQRARESAADIFFLHRISAWIPALHFYLEPPWENGEVPNDLPQFIAQRFIESPDAFMAKYGDKGSFHSGPTNLDSVIATIVTRSQHERIWAAGVASFLVTWAEELLKDPIRVQSGQWEAAPDTRTFLDMRNEIANRLANQSQFHATCSLAISGEKREYIISTPRYEVSDESHSFGQEIVEQIREQSRREYCTPRHLVESSFFQGQADTPPGKNLGRLRSVSLPASQPLDPMPILVTETSTAQPGSQASKATRFMYCLGCGLKISRQDQFCYQCGRPTDRALREPFR